MSDLSSSASQGLNMWHTCSMAIMFLLYLVKSYVLASFSTSICFPLPSITPAHPSEMAQLATITAHFSIWKALPWLMHYLTLSTTLDILTSGVPVHFALYWSGSVLCFDLLIVSTSLLSFRLSSMAF